MAYSINGNNGLISMKTINNMKDIIRKEEFNVDDIKNLVYTSDVINAAFPMKLSIIINGTQIETNLYYHFCEDLHKEITKEEYAQFRQLDNWQDDERIFFVKEGE